MICIRYSEIDLKLLVKLVIQKTLSIGFVEKDGSVIYTVVTANPEIAERFGCEVSGFAFNATKLIHSADSEQRFGYDVQIWDLMSKKLIPSNYFKNKMVALNILNLNKIQEIGLDKIYSEDIVYLFDGRDKDGEVYDQKSFESICRSYGYTVHRGSDLYKDAACNEIREAGAQVCRSKTLLKVSGIDIKFLNMVKTGWVDAIKR